MRNDHLEFRCDWQWLRVEHPEAAPAWLHGLRDGEPIRLPISHGEGRYVADPATLDELEAKGRVVLRYAASDGSLDPAANPNGSDRAIAGIVNEAGNVLGLMPHPERAAEEEVGGTDGLRLFRSLERWLHQRPAAAERRL
jgi:phosphoribosylformylglycinamidine synthase